MIVNHSVRVIGRLLIFLADYTQIAVNWWSGIGSFPGRMRNVVETFVLRGRIVKHNFADL
ncbi:MAG: hypothetical protein DI568_16840 [Sphingomonas sp.]|nr:MAG: hypothetical protein DI568_16840 [Sphingomonas sp.]